MRTYDELRKWFKNFPERLVIFTFGLHFSKGVMNYVLTNLMTFLTDSWNLRLKDAAAIINLQEGLMNMLQIHVALFIDAFLGYRRMLILSGLLYSAGLGLLALSVPRYFFNGEKKCRLDDSVHCFEKLKHTPFWEGLTLLILGGAAQVIPLYSLSFDQTKVLKGLKDYKPTRCCCFCKVQVGGWRILRHRIIRWLCIGFKMLGTVTSIYIFISFSDDWDRLFLKSAIAILLGWLWFLCGFPFYGPRRLQPTPLSTMLRALVAAVRKRHLNCQGNSEQLHHGDEEEKLLLTDHLGWLNNAAVKESPVDDNVVTEATRWRLCTIKEVAQTKLMLNMIPMSVTFIAYGMVKSLGNTFFVEQANSMRGSVSIVVLLQIIQRFSESAVRSWYQMVFEKRIKRIKGPYSDGVKIGMGMLASIICCAVAAPIEVKRLKALTKDCSHLDDPNANAPMSAFWLVPQFILLGAMEGLAGDGIQDFFSHYAPDSRRYGPVFTRSITGLGTVLNMAFIVILDYYSKKYSANKASWLGDSINQSRLDRIYGAYVVVALLNCFLYANVASRYSYDNIIGRPKEEEEVEFLEALVEETAGDDQLNDQGQVNV